MWSLLAIICAANLSLCNNHKIQVDSDTMVLVLLCHISYHQMLDARCHASDMPNDKMPNLVGR